MLLRSALGATLLLVFAASTLGCPAPTGRRRGVDAASGTCSSPTQPFSGLPCRLNNEQCSFDQPCGFNGVTSTSCTCGSGVWNCVSNGICQVVVRDSGPMECPGHVVVQDEPCAARQGGLYCSGLARSCDDAGTTEAFCYCTGTIWSCRATGCTPPMCPPLPPTAFDPCSPRMECFYSPSQAHTTCPLTCFCDASGTFSCSENCVFDVPDPDATDVQNEADVLSDDANDADDAAFDDASDADDATTSDDASEMDAATD